MSEFLAEASVLIEANTRAFRAELAAALATVPKAIEIPIVAVAQTGSVASAAATLSAAAKTAAASAGQTAGAATVTTTALQEQGNAAAVAGAKTKELAAAQSQALQINRAFAATEHAVAVAQLEVVGAANAQEAAQIALQRQAAAGAAAQELLTQAQLSGLNVERLLASETVATAVAMGEKAAATRIAAAADEQAATAARHHATQLANVGRGSATAGLAAAGLRGATLTANAAFIAGAAAAISFGKSIQSAAKFETSLNVFGATAGATAEQMKEVSAAAQQLGQDITLPSVSAQDAADAMTELAKAGLSVQDSIDGARGVLQLATAANIDNAQATELAASGLNAFGLAGDQAVHVADVLANAANQSQGSIVDIGTALAQAAAVGRQAGLSLEQVTGVLTIFARNGLVGSDAGTSFRTMLLRLINPTDKAAKLINDLGLNLRTATGAIDLTVFDQFSQATENLTKRERDRDQAIIFGQDAIRGAAIATRVGSAAIVQQTEALGKAGTAAEVAGARTEGLAGAFENAKNQAAQFGLTLGRISSGPVQVFLAATANLFESLNQISSTIGSILHPEGASFDEASKNFTELAEAAARLQQQLSEGAGDEFTGQLTVGLQATAKELENTGKELVRQGFLTTVLDTFIRLSPQVRAAMRDNVIIPAEEAELQATALGRAFLGAVPHTAELFQSFGLAAKDGIEQARTAIKSTGPSLAAAMAEAIHDGTNQVTPQAQVDGAELGDSLGKSIAAGISAAKGAISDAFAGLARGARLDIGRLSSQLLDVQFQGGSDAEQRKILERQLNREQDLVKTLEIRGAPQAKIDEAKRAAIETQDQIDAIDEAAQQRVKAAASAREQQAKQTAQEAQRARDAADQAIFDSFAGGQNRINLAQISANSTNRLSDDIKLQTLIITTAEREKKIIEDTVKDVKERNTAIAERVQTIKAADAERDRLLIEAAKTATENRRKAADAFTEALGKSITLAGLRENDQAQIEAINKAIANAKFRIRNYKRLGLNLQDEKIALEQLINDRDEVRKKTEDAAKATGSATTAFDLLKEAADTFNKSAGNLINGNQPFAGPTGFTADIAQFLIRRQQPPAPTSTSRITPSVPPVPLQDQPLIQAIEKLTDAIVGNTPGNTSTSTGTRQSRRWHAENMLARQFQEG